MTWSCTLVNGIIEVYNDRIREGEYSLVEEPYCKKCSHPNVKTEECGDHGFFDSIDRIYAMGWYFKVRERKADDLLSIHIIKSKKDSSYIVPLGLSMAITAKSRYRELLDYDFIVPVPLHQNKQSNRGYNQALELAKILGSELKISVLNALIKTRDIDFRGRSWSGRYQQIENLYRVNPYLENDVKEKKIIIVDDVVTTGITLDGCAKVLKSSGALSVVAFAATRTRSD